MENNEESARYAAGDLPSVSSEEARRSLAEVDDLNQATSWRPNLWALAAVSAIFAVVIALWVWDHYLWGLGVFATMGGVGFLLRRHLSNPYIRQRPWQSLEQQNNYQPKQRLLSASIVFWPVLTSAFPAEPRWIGVVAGTFAAVHMCYALRKLGNSL